MEGLLPEYGVFGSVRQPTGSRIPTAAPSSAYPCSDGKWVLVGSQLEPLFAKLSELMGQPDLPGDPRFANNPARVKNVEDLDRIIGNPTKELTAEEADRRSTRRTSPAPDLYGGRDRGRPAIPRTRHGPRRGGPAIRQGSPSGVVPHVPDDPGVIHMGPASPIGAHSEDVSG